MKEENEENSIKYEKISKDTKSGNVRVCNNEVSIGIRPRPLICKPSNVECKTEPIERKWQWAPGAWQDATRTSAFQPYKPSTLLTNLQRGNTKTEITLPHEGSDITFYTLAGQGELTQDHINQVVSSGMIDKPDENGLTGLMWAAQYGQLNSTRLLLKAGADKEFCGAKGETALHLAAAFGHHYIVKLLIDHGADVNAEENEGNTPLIYAAHGDHPHVCYELLSKGAGITHRNVHEQSALKIALTNKSLQAKAVILNHMIQEVLKNPLELI